MAEILSKQFTSVFSTPTPNPLLENSENKTTADTIKTLDFNKNDIELAIVELFAQSASGTYGFPAILLKNCKKSPSYPLTLLWKKTIDEGKIPEPLKQSIIPPKHKGGSREQPANY